LNTYRANAARVAGAAIVLLVPLNLLATATATEIDTATDQLDVTAVSRLALALIAGLGAALGAVGFAGVLDQLVAEQRRGLPKQPILAVLRAIPYLRLLLATLLMAAVIIAGILLFILPGLLAVTLFVLTGPLIGSGESVMRSFRRSARLVRPHLWLVVRVVTLPMLASELLDDALAVLVESRSRYLSVLVSNGVVAATLGAVIALVQVVLTEELLERDEAGNASARPAAPSGSDASAR
jgi:hypothetical protein